MTITKLLELAKEAGPELRRVVENNDIDADLERFAALVFAQGWSEAIEATAEVCTEKEKDVLKPGRAITAARTAWDCAVAIRSLKRPLQAQEPKAVGGADAFGPNKSGCCGITVTERCAGFRLKEQMLEWSGETDLIEEAADRIADLEADRDAAIARIAAERSDRESLVLRIAELERQVAELRKDKELLDEMASEYWKVDPFSMPTPGGDGQSIAMQTIIGELQYWLSFNERQHGSDPVTDETHVIPPMWPSRGVLKNWISALSQSSGQKG